MRTEVLRRTIVSLALGLCLTAGSRTTIVYGQVRVSPEWTTSSFNPQRDAWQRNETKITPENAKDIQLLWKLKTDNKTMGMQSFREPLIVSNIDTGLGKHSLAILAGSSNDVYAIDADTGKLIWQKRLKWLSDQP